MIRAAGMVLLLLLADLAPSSPPASQIERCPPSASYALTCYGPAGVGRAERRFAGQAINPSRVVRRVTGLDLRQVSVGRRLLAKPGRRSVILTYDYGQQPPMAPSISGSSLPAPSWVEVAELANLLQDVKAATISRDEIQTGIAGGATTTTWGNWEFRANVGGRRMSIVVTSDGKKAVVRTIGCALLKESAVSACP